MVQHSYVNLRYGVLHSRDYVTASGHRIHLGFDTTFYDHIVWG